MPPFLCRSSQVHLAVGMHETPAFQGFDVRKAKSCSAPPLFIQGPGEFRLWPLLRQRACLSLCQHPFAALPGTAWISASGLKEMKRHPEGQQPWVPDERRASLFLCAQYPLLQDQARSLCLCLVTPISIIIKSSLVTFFPSRKTAPESRYCAISTW